MQKRVRDREKEAESDERDRKREKEELEEIRQRLLAEGHPDPDAELQRVRHSFTPSLYVARQREAQGRQRAWALPASWSPTLDDRRKSLETRAHKQVKSCVGIRQDQRGKPSIPVASQRSGGSPSLSVLGGGR